MSRHRWAIERDEVGMPVRMVWMGIDFAAEPARCEYAFTDRAGRIYGCTLLKGHAGTGKGRHNFERLT